MKDYKVFFYLKTRIALMFLIFLVSVIPITISLYKYNILGYITIGIYGIFVIIFPFFVFPKLYAKAVYQVHIYTNEIVFECIKPYLWCKPLQLIRIDWKELKSYKYEPSSNFDLFRLRLRNGKKIKFYRFYYDIDDDFDVFMQDFRRKVKIYNKTNSTNPIEEEKLIMNNKIFLWIVTVILIIVFIGTIILLAFKGVSNIKGIMSILIILGPLAWVMNQIIKGLRKSKD